MSLASRRTVIAYTVGMAFYWPVFCGLFLPGTSSLDSELVALGNTSLFLTVQTVLLLTFCVAFVSVSRRLESTKSLLRHLRQGTVIASGILLIAFISATLLVRSIPALETASTVILALLSALHAFLLPMAWAMIAEGLSAKTHPLALLFSVFLGAICTYLLQEAGLLLGYSRTISLIILPLLSTLVLLTVSVDHPRRTYVHRRIDSKELAAEPLTRLVLILVVYDFVCVALRLIILNNFAFDARGQSLILNRAITAIAAAVLVLLVYRSIQLHRKTVFPWIIVISIFIASLSIVVMFGSSVPLFCYEFVLSTHFFSLVFLWFVLVSISRTYHYQTASRIAAIFIPASSIPTGIMFGSWPISEAVNLLTTREPYRLSLILLTAFILTVTAFSYIITSTRKDAARDRTASSVQDDRQLEIARNRLRKRFNLTEREVEVLHLLARGHTQKKIAETLFLSVNSTQTYSKNIYRKMGIHCRQEAIDLEEQEMRNGTSR